MNRQTKRRRRRDLLLHQRLADAATPRRRLQAACDHLVAVCADLGEERTTTAVSEVLGLAERIQT